MITARLLLGVALIPGPEDEWQRLDRELAALVQEAQEEDDEEEEDGPSFEAYMKTSYRYSDDLVFTHDPVTFEDMGDLSGFEIDTMAIVVRGDVGPFQYKISYNPENQKLRSTYARFRPWEPVRVTLGRYKAPLLRTRLMRTTRLLFLARTIQAIQTGPRDEGVKVEVELGDDVTWYTSLQNGEDGQSDEYYAATRLAIDLLGNGVKDYEGAYKAGSKTRLSVGLGLADDGTVDDGRVLAADAAFTKGRFSLHGEILDHGDDLPNYRKGLLDPATILVRGDTTPWDATAIWMILEKKLEAAVRWEELDDPNHTSRLSLGLNLYRKGHKAKWQLNWLDVQSDLPGLESDMIAVGFVIDA